MTDIEEIKSRLDIVEVISGYLRLTRAGRNFKALCPFHNEKSPSFMVNPERQIWHCFGCGEGGDIFTFVMKMDGLEFKEALKLLADRAGVKLKNFNPKESGQKARVMEITKISTRFFQECLKVKGGKKAKEYFASRGLENETIENFKLGYAPNSWNLLSDFLKKKGFKDKEIFLSGMSVKKDRGGYYDRFRHRLIFPIANLSGEIIGFSARAMPGADEKSAKYINTPETPIYNKSSVLFGLDKAKLAIRKKDKCILVEGNMDVIMSHQAGVENVVAASGTALTSEQLRVIKRYTDNLALAFDMDKAGQAAAKRGIELALQEELDVSVIAIPEGKDPADTVKNNPKEWIEAAEKSQPVMDFYFDQAFSKFNPQDVRGKKEIAKEMLNVIGKISNKIEQAHYLQILARRLEIDEDILRDTLRKAKIAKSSGLLSRDKSGKIKVTDKKTKLQERLIGFAIVCPELLKGIIKEIKNNLAVTNPVLKKISDQIINSADQNQLSAAELKILKENLDDELSEKWDLLAMSAEMEIDRGVDAGEEIKICLNELEKIKLGEDRQRLEADLKKAIQKNDQGSCKLLLEEIDKLDKRRNEIDGN